MYCLFKLNPNKKKQILHGEYLSHNNYAQWAFSQLLHPCYLVNKLYFKIPAVKSTVFSRKS
jgi:hypothetical protein